MSALTKRFMCTLVILFGSSVLKAQPSPVEVSCAKYGLDDHHDDLKMHAKKALISSCLAQSQRQCQQAAAEFLSEAYGKLSPAQRPVNESILGSEAVSAPWPLLREILSGLKNFRTRIDRAEEGFSFRRDQSRDYCDLSLALEALARLKVIYRKAEFSANIRNSENYSKFIGCLDSLQTGLSVSLNSFWKNTPDCTRENRTAPHLGGPRKTSH